jgi:hypothetical protein
MDSCDVSELAEEELAQVTCGHLPWSDQRVIALELEVGECDLAPEVHADVERPQRVGECADCEIVDAGTGVLRGGVQGQAAQRLEQRVGCAGVAALHRDLGLPHRKVVQQHQLDIHTQHIIELLERIDLDFARQIRCGTADGVAKLPNASISEFANALMLVRFAICATACRRCCHGRLFTQLHDCGIRCIGIA